jgi:hypothetical protein
LEDSAQLQQAMLPLLNQPSEDSAQLQPAVLPLLNQPSEDSAQLQPVMLPLQSQTLPLDLPLQPLDLPLQPLQASPFPRSRPHLQRLRHQRPGHPRRPRSRSQHQLQLPRRLTVPPRARRRSCLRLHWQPSSARKQRRCPKPRLPRSQLGEEEALSDLEAWAIRSKRRRAMQLQQLQQPVAVAFR